MKNKGPPRRPSIGLTPDRSDESPYRYELKAAYADAVLRDEDVSWSAGLSVQRRF